MVPANPLPPAMSLHMPSTLYSPVKMAEGRSFSSTDPTLPFPTPVVGLEKGLENMSPHTRGCGLLLALSSHSSAVQARVEDDVRPDFWNTCHFKNQRVKTLQACLESQRAQHRTRAANTVTLDYLSGNRDFSSSLHTPSPPALGTHFSSSPLKLVPLLYDTGLLTLAEFLSAIFSSPGTLSVSRYSHG